MCVSPESPLFDAAMEKLAACSLAIARGETAPILFLEYAETLWIVRDLQATIAALDRAIDGTPSLPDHELGRAYASRAICHLQMGHLDAALADATVSLDLSPRGHAAALRAMTYLHQGNHAAAVADAEEGVRMDQDDWEARAWRGMTYMEAGRYAEAIRDFNWVLATGECARYASELYLGRARAALALGDPAAAVADCRLAIDADYQEQAHWPYIVRARVRHAHEPYLVRAEARLQLGETARALGDCYLAASITPDDPAVYDLRARVHYAIGNLQEVIRDTIRADHLRRKAGGLQAEPAHDPSDHLVGASTGSSHV
jgi:tetratricopeptide (TPR) repeat protein